MITNVVESLIPHIRLVPWVDVVGGIASPLQKGDQIAPAWYDITQGKWIDLSPDSKKRGIVFFRADECEVISNSGGKINERCTLNIMCWYNLKQINVDEGDSRPVLDICDAIPGKLWNTNGIITARMKYQNTIRNIVIWNEYTFNENKQYTMYPYGAFMVTYDALYWYAKGCHIKNLNPSIC